MTVWIVIEEDLNDWNSYPVYVASSRDHAEAWAADRPRQRSKRHGYKWRIEEWAIDGDEV